VRGDEWGLLYTHTDICSLMGKKENSKGPNQMEKGRKRDSGRLVGDGGRTPRVVGGTYAFRKERAEVERRDEGEKIKGIRGGLWRGQSKDLESVFLEEGRAGGDHRCR